MPVPRIIAIAAPVGGGKTMLSRALGAALGGVPVLHFDDYERASLNSTAQLEAWMAAGADFGAWMPAELASALLASKEGTIGSTGGDVPTHVVVELPLGREHAGTRHLIDHLVWIDTPLELALARHLRMLTGNLLATPDADTRAFVEWLDGYLDSYARVVHAIMCLQRERVGASADQKVNGSQTTAAQVAAILRRLELPARVPAP